MAQSGPVSWWRSLRVGERWTVTVALIGVVVALGAWWFPQSPDSADDAGRASRTTTVKPSPQGSPVGDGPPTGAADPTATAADVTLLDTQSPESGAANLTELPRALAGEPGYDHPIVVTCPSNQTGDLVREVTYLMRGRYLDFAAEVRPYFDNVKDARAEVAVIAVEKQRDDSLTRRETGRESTTMTAAPAPLTAEVDGAEQLTLQIRCEDPHGVVALVAARLTRAPG